MTASAPRTILYTGKGGVGKTSVAAATARRCAAAGLRTVVLSTDPAHSLADALEAQLGPDPTPVCERLWGQEVQAEREMEANWGAVQRWLGALLNDRGVMDIAAEELSVPPGMDELFSLLQIKRHHDSGQFDAVIVDCAPTGETLRLLGFPDIAHWWLEKVFPWERRLVNAARPIARMIDVEIPGEDVLAEVQVLVRQMIAMNEILRDRERASIRLVMNPDRMVIKEAQRTFTYLNLYGYLTDAVIVNRVFPEELAGGYFGEWHERQQEQLEEVHAGFAPVPVLTARYFEEEVIGTRMLDRLGDELFGDELDPAAVMHTGLAHEISSSNGTATLRIQVPFGERGEIGLKKVGAELIVSVGPRKRTIILPAALARRSPTGAKLADGSLEVSFETRAATSEADGHP
ncbi:MAG: arsenite/tail-anchored protein-transporting ATPase [Solirubrobacterales bacterium]|jgi:arsenite-transporting ATPase|nr:arsenite/tail-anchored protein-transporting ATPase [Solirubrobacterales bacterium]